MSDCAATRKPAGQGVILEDGTNVDVIATGAWDADDLPDDPVQRMFVLSHWWAVQTARPTRLLVTSGAATVAQATARVAVPPALVAAKLQAMRTRRGDTAAKVTSDVYDTYRLLSAYDSDGSVAAALASAPADLGSWCGTALGETLVDDASRWAGRINASFATAAITAEDLAVVGSLAAEGIRRTS
ncbi:MAG: hypothetical protein ACYDAD_10095 [Acidimicrobiales bacterium]